MQLNEANQPNDSDIEQSTTHADVAVAVVNGGGNNNNSEEEIDHSENNNNNIHNDDDNGNQSSPRKERLSASGNHEAGAVQVNEQAPQVNRRFFLGLNRPSARARNAERRRRRRAALEDDDNLDAQQVTQTQRRTSVRASRRRGSSVASVTERMSNALARLGSMPMVEATLVESTVHEEDHGEVYEAERVGYCESRWKMFAVIMGILLVLLAVLLSVFIEKSVFKNDGMAVATLVPSVQPSSSPSHDTGSTLDIVRERGYIRCGISEAAMKAGTRSFTLGLCRAIASVLFGGDFDNNLEAVKVTGANRFMQLQDRQVDLLISEDTHTVGRELKEKTTGVGFTFSSPYYYDGLTYFGNETYVRCAEEHRRYGDCSSLNICVVQESTSYAFVEFYFPSDFFTVVPTLEERTKLLLDGTCNVIASDKLILLNIASQDKFKNSKFIVGEKLMTKEPLAFVTRNDDREFSDIINWILHALFYGEEQGLSKNSSLCQNYTTPQMTITDLSFLNAVFCVGNYGDIVFDGREVNRGMNQINNGNSGMIYAIPFGEVEDADADYESRESQTETLLDDIRDDGLLRCGVNAPEGFTGNITNSDKVVGMSVHYCRTLAAALFNGNWEAVQFVTFSKNVDDSYTALNNGTIDVISGARIEKKYDFESTSLGGFQYSTPFYYGNETGSDDVSFFSIGTREGDAAFSSFVNNVVLATIALQEDIDNGQNTVMQQLLSLYGYEFHWALRDAVAFSDGYNTIYEKNFGDVPYEKRGRNVLNSRGRPQINSFPGLGQ